MKEKVFILLFSLLAAYGCSNAEKSGSASDTAVLNLEKALDDAENINLSLYASSLRYIPLQTTESSAIGKILHLCHNDGCFYISSIGSKEIAVFSESGEFIRKINRNGRGPGEYTGISGLFADYDADAKGAIGVLCQSAFVYDSEGRYIKRLPGIDSLQKEKYWIDNILHMENGEYIAICRIPDKEDVSTQSESFALLDNNGNIKSVLPAGKSCFKRNITPEMVMIALRPSNVSVYNGQINVIKGAFDTVYAYNSDYERRTRYIVDYGKYYDMAFGDLFSPEAISVTKPFIEKDDFLIFRMFLPKGEFIATKKEDKSEAPKAVVTFLYDKKEERLISLAQDEVSAVSGFVNDMDGGINFTPDFFTGGKMYQIVEADLFMEYAQTSDSPRMKRIAERISEDSNPVMIEATFK